MNKVKYGNRYLARFIIKAATPLSIGSGESNMLTDSLVVLDVNGLPFIPGTTLAGVIRNSIKVVDNVNGTELTNAMFGYQDAKDSQKGHGSDIIFTDAKMIGKEGEVIDGLQTIDYSDDFYRHFIELPIRQHVRIGHTGTTEGGGKFDEQIVFKGTCFCFEIEYLYDGSSEQRDLFRSVLNELVKPTFRIGSGSRNGYGRIEIISVMVADLCLYDQLDVYLKKSSNLQQCADWWKENGKQITELLSETLSDDYDIYKLVIQPNSFFLFGSGMRDEEADITPVKSTYIKWDDDMQKAQFVTNAILIPASSVKGALAHRVAFYYNQLDEKFADDPRISIEEYVGSRNEAVRALFGYQENQEQVRGNILISDVIISSLYQEKLLNHVSIDRFTGGAVDGALFAEKTIYDKGPYEFELFVKKSALTNVKIKEALEHALLDICNGLLPLGGGVNRGNGCFRGKLIINGEEL